MATVVDTLSEALEVYNNRYQNALQNNSKREIEPFRSKINQINSYYDIINAAVGENATTRAQDALDAIVAILNAEDIIISDPVTPPLGIGILVAVNNILVPTDAAGGNPDYTNAFSDINIFLGGTDSTANWTFTVQTQTNVTATITTPVNRVVISSLTADEGSVIVRATRSSYSDIDITIPVKRLKQGETGGGVDQDLGTLRLIPQDEGSPAGNTRGNNSIDFQTVRLNATQVSSGDRAVCGGGSANTPSGAISTIAGGNNNVASNTGAFVGGGALNVASGIAGAIGGGTDNTASGDYGLIGGGDLNTASGDYSSVTGGKSNTASGDYSLGGGGENNLASGDYSSSFNLFNTAATYGEMVVGCHAENVAGNANSFDTADPVFRVGIGANSVARQDGFRVNKDGGVFASQLKSGANQGAAGAVAGELWIDTADNSIKIGV